MQPNLILTDELVFFYCVLSTYKSKSISGPNLDNMIKK